MRYTKKNAILLKLNQSSSKMAKDVGNYLLWEVPSGFEPLYEVLQTSA